jgi:hypothetical protein
MDKKISQLSSAAALTGTEVIPVVQGGSTVKTTAQDIADLAPRSYLVYTALLTQTGANAPVATVLENTIGNITWGYFGYGNYTANSSNLFGDGSTNLYCPSAIVNGTFPPSLAHLIVINTSASIIEYACEGDNLLLNTPIEIRVYP